MALPNQSLLERRVLIGLGSGWICLFGFGTFGSLFAGWVGLFLLCAFLFLFRFQSMETVASRMGLSCLAFSYVPLLLGHLVWLRNLDAGVHWIILTLVVVMCGDSAAYFTGSAWGRRRLYPAVSPNKSLEGALGGLVGSLIGACVYKGFFLPDVSFGFVIALALLLGVLGQVGDLFESLLKRSFKVKDSGTLIPGHGGILDRLDSLLFAFAPAYYFIFFFG